MAIEDGFDKLPPIVQYIGWVAAGLASLGFWLMGKRKSESITPPPPAALSQAEIVQSKLDNELLHKDLMKVLEARRETVDQQFAQQTMAINRQFEGITTRLNDHADRLRDIELKLAARHR